MRTSIMTRAIAFAAVALAAETGGPAAAAAAEPAAESVAVNPQILPLKDESQVDELKAALGGQRKVFSDFDSAYAHLTAMSEAEKTKDLFGLPVAIVGYDSDKNEVDPAVYEGADAILALVGARGVPKAGGKDKEVFNSVKAIVIYPVPTLASFLGMTLEAVAAIPEAQRNWLEKIVTKETSHTAFRNFRDTATLNELMNGAKAAPKSVDDYVTARESDGLNTDTFDALWSSFRTMLRTNQPAVFKLLPSKGEVIKAIRSKSYALANDETKPLEESPIGSIFVKIGEMLVVGAKQNKDKDGKPQPLEHETIQGWLDGRDSLNLTRATAEKDFSALDSIKW